MPGPGQKPGQSRSAPEQLTSYFLPEALDKIRRLLRVSSTPPTADDRMPLMPPPPSMFQPDPPINAGGDRSLAQVIRQLVDLDPNVKRKVRSVQVGENDDVIDWMRERGLIPGAFRHTNLMGLTNLKTGDVALNPVYYGLPQTLAHELNHVARIGQGIPPARDEVEARRIGSIADAGRLSDSYTKGF